MRLALAVCLVPLGWAELEAQEPPVFRTGIGMVVLQATVRNARSELVKDLGATAFTVYENGRAQPITLFRQGEVPVSLGVLLDNSQSIRGRRATVESIALAALRVSNPQDETFLMNFADRFKVDVPLTGDAQALATAVHRSDSIGGTALRDAVAEAERYLSEHAINQHRALVVITDGNDNASTTSEEQLEADTEQNRIVIYTIGLLNLDDMAKAKRGREALERLAESSGGAARYPAGAEQADEVGTEVARQARHVYTIGYVPLAQALDGSYRKLRVEAKGRERLWVRTRPGYRAAPGKTG
jgi:VWFA-related protein